MEIALRRIRCCISFVGFSKSSQEFNKETKLLHVLIENEEVRKSLYSVV